MNQTHTYQFWLAVALVCFGVVLLIVAFCLPPAGLIDPTVLTAYGETLTFAGALIGLVIGLALIRLSVKRSRKQYEINHANCVACGQCFSYCPQNKQMNESHKPSES